MTKTQTIAISLYFVIVVMCVALFIVGDQLSLTARDAIVPLAADGFKLAIGALIGSISAILGVGAR